MTLREVTRTVIARVEEVSGCPVVVSEDASLKTLAASRIARGENRIHAISFNPSVVREPDYLICYQCGFILRLFAVPVLQGIRRRPGAARKTARSLTSWALGFTPKEILPYRPGPATYDCGALFGRGFWQIMSLSCALATWSNSSAESCGRSSPRITQITRQSHCPCDLLYLRRENDSVARVH
jgi:hypothetical protein